MMPESRNLFRLARLLLLGGFLLLLPTQAWASSGDHAKKVTGQVVAVNTLDTPNTIVLRSVTGNSQELIVGAMVEPDVTIKREDRSVRLSDIRIGDNVTLTYVKTLEGLVARSIKAR